MMTYTRGIARPLEGAQFQHKGIVPAFKIVNLDFAWTTSEFFFGVGVAAILGDFAYPSIAFWNRKVCRDQWEST
ncbi:MAG: hypothetical protein AAGJ35_15445 [Myxococcota bacterium]